MSDARRWPSDHGLTPDEPREERSYLEVETYGPSEGATVEVRIVDPGGGELEVDAVLRVRLTSRNALAFATEVYGRAICADPSLLGEVEPGQVLIGRGWTFDTCALVPTWVRDLLRDVLDVADTSDSESEVYLPSYLIDRLRAALREDA